MLAWCIFFHHFTFNLPIILNLKWVPCRQHTDDTQFKIQFVNLCLLIAGLRSFKMNTVIDRWRFKSYTCFFVYCLFISVLHSLIFSLTFPFWFMLSVFEYFCFLSGCSMYYFLNYLIFVCLKNMVTLPSDLHSFWWELCCNSKCSPNLLIAKVLSLSLFQNFLCIFFPECFISLTIILICGFIWVSPAWALLNFLNVERLTDTIWRQ